jgi:exonuclease III
MSHTFRVLQYNVNKSKDKVMASFLQDSSVANYDIIAVQEPWRNTHNHATFNPRNSAFHACDARAETARVCCYINKRISTDSWTETHHSDDLMSITLRFAGDRRVVNIHNCYNPPPLSHSESSNLGTLDKLPQALSMSGEHILLGDFNLHHPLWCGPSYPLQHTLSDSLLTITREAGLSLALPTGTITRRIHTARRIQETTIDLSFLTHSLHDYVYKCRAAPELDHGSDHLPVSTELEWEIAPKAQAKRQRRAWKKIDQAALLESFKLHTATLENSSLSNREEIDSYVASLTQAISISIEDSTPWLKSGFFAQPFWI